MLYEVITNEFEEHPFPFSLLARSESFPLFQGGSQDLPPCVIGKHNIDKPGPGYGEIPEPPFSVFPPDGFEQLHRDVSGFPRKKCPQFKGGIRGT